MPPQIGTPPTDPAAAAAPPAEIAGATAFRRQRGRLAKQSPSPSSQPEQPDAAAIASQRKRGRPAKQSPSPSPPPVQPDAAAIASHRKRGRAAKQSPSPSSLAPGTIVAAVEITGRVASLRKRSRSGVESPPEAPPSMRKRGKAAAPDSIAAEKTESSRPRKGRKSVDVVDSAVDGGAEGDDDVDDEEEEVAKAAPAKRKGTEKTESSRPRKGRKSVDVVETVVDGGAEEDDDDDEEEEVAKAAPAKRKGALSLKAGDDSNACFVGDPIPEDEAKNRWPLRYQRKKGDDPDEIGAMRHYKEARVDGILYGLNDCVYVQADVKDDNYIGRIVEFFEGCDNRAYFTAQWFYRTRDTVIKDSDRKRDAKGLIISEDENENALDCSEPEEKQVMMESTCIKYDPQRVFISEDQNVNDLDCIVSKLSIVQLSPNIDSVSKTKALSSCDFYFDMSYSMAYSTFATVSPVKGFSWSGASSKLSTLAHSKVSKSSCKPCSQSNKAERTLLDLYSGCGAMSTGLCLGAKLAGINLVTKWAVDINKHACESLTLNHPEAEVRNENAEDFLSLLREWEKLCQKYGLFGNDWTPGQDDESSDSDDNDEHTENDVGNDDDELFEVRKIIGICFGDPQETGVVGLKFLIRWKGYGPDDDTWEPLQGLSGAEESLASFVRRGYQKRILPLPGLVDTICGGPPCQGISGFNRFREKAHPLADKRNKQLLVYMDIVEFLKPKHVLMENVVDLLKFAGGFLGRFAVGRLVYMNYQTRLGIVAAGSFGLPQFRMRCFLWGAQSSEILPKFPLPIHDVIVRGGAPNEFEANLVAFNENEKPQLKNALVLEDAISDLPPAFNDGSSEERDYEGPPNTEFQQFIRLPREGSASGKLYDHIPLRLNPDDYQRVCQIPRRKGANFRDLPGVLVGLNNTVEWDPLVPRVILPSGKPLVPEYAMTFKKGKSPKPFGRLWWDSTVPTVVTRAEPHNQIILHPVQDRVLTIRENARLQGFPDYYKLCGPIKERYIQVGNAVAVPVSRALGYSLGLAYRNLGNDDPVFQLPASFPHVTGQ